MLHNNQTAISPESIYRAEGNTSTLHLASPGQTTRERSDSSGRLSAQLLELIAISTRRCSAFFAEAAVLVLVFGILDYFMLRGRIELPWIVGAIGISVGLLVASIAMDFTAQRWIKAHP